jgi:hypothetical protein
MPADLNPILSKLISKTEEGRVRWKLTYETDTFIAPLEGEFTFQIAKVGNQYDFLMKDKQGNSCVEISSRDHDEFNSGYRPDDDYFEHLEKLYELARDIALDVPKKLTDAETLLDRF